MKRPIKTNEDTPPQLLQPVTVEETASRKAKELEIDVPPGYVYIVALNADGSEKQNSGFFYPEKNHQRFYGDKTKYSVKKKVQ